MTRGTVAWSTGAVRSPAGVSATNSPSANDAWAGPGEGGGSRSPTTWMPGTAVSSRDRSAGTTWPRPSVAGPAAASPGPPVTGSRPTATSSRSAATVTVPPRAVRTTARTPSSTTSVSSSRAPVWLRALAVFFRVPLTGAAAALTELLTTLADTGIRPLRPFRPGAPSPERAYVDCAGPP